MSEPLNLIEGDVVRSLQNGDEGTIATTPREHGEKISCLFNGRKFYIARVDLEVKRDGEWIRIVEEQKAIDKPLPYDSRDPHTGDITLDKLISMYRERRSELEELGDRIADLRVTVMLRRAMGAIRIDQETTDRAVTAAHAYKLKKDTAQLRAAVAKADESGKL